MSDELKSFVFRPQPTVWSLKKFNFYRHFTILWYPTAIFSKLVFKFFLKVEFRHQDTLWFTNLLSGLGHFRLWYLLCVCYNVSLKLSVYWEKNKDLTSSVNYTQLLVSLFKSDALSACKRLFIIKGGACLMDLPKWGHTEKLVQVYKRP